MVSVSLSTRVSPGLRERLAGEARSRGVDLSTLARDLLAAGLDGDAGHPDADGAVQNEVECVFHALPPEAGVYHQVCLALARTVEGGGSAGVTAARELLHLTDFMRRRYQPEDEDDEDDEDEDGFLRD